MSCGKTFIDFVFSNRCDCVELVLTIRVEKKMLKKDVAIMLISLKDKIPTGNSLKKA